MKKGCDTVAKVPEDGSDRAPQDLEARLVTTMEDGQSHRLLSIFETGIFFWIVAFNMFVPSIFSLLEWDCLSYTCTTPILYFASWQFVF